MKRKPTAKKVARKTAKGGNDDVDALLNAAEGGSGSDSEGDVSDTAPPTAEELQEILDKGVLGSYIDGKPSVCGTILRPITSACVTMLKQIESGLVAGLKLNEIDNMALHSARFVVLWQDDTEGDGDEDDYKRQLRESRRLIRPENADELEELAYGWLDSVSPQLIGEVTNQSIFALRDAMSTQVTPLPRKGDENHEEEDEVEGNV